MKTLLFWGGYFGGSLLAGMIAKKALGFDWQQALAALTAGTPVAGATGALAGANLGAGVPTGGVGDIQIEIGQAVFEEV